MHFDPNSCNKSNKILERTGNDFVNKYFKFVGLKLDEFLNWDFQIEHILNKMACSTCALSQIKKILQLNIRLLAYNSLSLVRLEKNQKKKAIRAVNNNTFKAYSNSLFSKLKLNIAEPNRPTTPLLEKGLRE